MLRLKCGGFSKISEERYQRVYDEKLWTRKNGMGKTTREQKLGLELKKKSMMK